MTTTKPEEMFIAILLFDLYYIWPIKCILSANDNNNNNPPCLPFWSSVTFQSAFPPWRSSWGV